MGFFDDVPMPPSEPEEEPPEPEWFGPPEDWLGGVVPLEVLVGRSSKAAIYLTSLVAYPTGFSLTVNALTREPTDLALDAFGYGPPVATTGGGSALPAEVLRYGIEFPDGRRATSAGEFFSRSSGSRIVWAVGEGPEPDPGKDLILTPGSGSGGRRHSEERCWVWPLPPNEGEVLFVCEWPLFEIAESAAAVESTMIHQAVARAESVWR